jgi:hypothetical protein
MPLANFDIIERLSTEEFLVIRDVGPHDRYQTVTNAAEEVVETLAKDGRLPEGRRLFYFDSDNRLDQLLVVNGRFAGFCLMNQHWHDEVMKLDNC